VFEDYGHRRRNDPNLPVDSGYGISFSHFDDSFLSQRAIVKDSLRCCRPLPIHAAFARTNTRVNEHLGGTGPPALGAGTPVRVIKRPKFEMMRPGLKLNMVMISLEKPAVMAARIKAISGGLSETNRSKYLPLYLAEFSAGAA
jgi:hypothetical protein